jgi:hypothetical protein
MKKLLLCLGLCAATWLFASCDNNDTSSKARGRLQVQESGDGIEVRGPDGSILIKGNQENASLIINAEGEKEVEINLGNNKLAGNFPADIPVFPDSDVAMNQVFQNGMNAIATLTTREKAEKVVEFYEEQIPLKGWEPGERFDLDNIVMLNGKRGNANLNISITTENEMTTINMARTEAAE